jgi:hypothetical protein
MSAVVRELVEAAEAFDAACDSADYREFQQARSRLRAVLPRITVEDDVSQPSPAAGSTEPNVYTDPARWGEGPDEP